MPRENLAYKISAIRCTAAGKGSFPLKSDSFVLDVASTLDAFILWCSTSHKIYHYQIHSVHVYFFYHREILEEIAEYERQMSRESMKSSLTQRIQLEPIQGGGRDKLLQQVSGHA